MASEQLDLDLELAQLPHPKITREEIQATDTPIKDDPLIVPGKLKHGVVILEAMEELSGDPLNSEIHRPRCIGYREIAGRIFQKYGIHVASSSIGYTIRELIRLGFVKHRVPAAFAEAVEYQALTTTGMKATMDKAGATHVRTFRRHVELIGSIGR